MFKSYGLILFINSFSYSFNEETSNKLQYWLNLSKSIRDSSSYSHIWISEEFYLNNSNSSFEDILFKKINQDVNLIEQWADYTINYHYQKFLNVKKEFKVKSEYYNLGVK